MVSKTECNGYLEENESEIPDSHSLDLFILSSEAVLEQKEEIEFCAVGNGYENNCLCVHEHPVTRNTSQEVIRTKERIATEKSATV